MLWRSIEPRVSYRILRLRGGHFFGIVNICMQNRHCANHAFLGGSGGRNFKKIAALRLNLVGFGS